MASAVDAGAATEEASTARPPKSIHAETGRRENHLRQVHRNPRCLELGSGLQNRAAISMPFTGPPGLLIARWAPPKEPLQWGHAKRESFA